MKALCDPFTYLFKAVLIAGLAGFSLLAAIPDALAAGYDVNQIRAPGPAVRMSSAGYLTGTYQVKCSKLVGREYRGSLSAGGWLYSGDAVSYSDSSYNVLTYLPAPTP